MNRRTLPCVQDAPIVHRDGSSGSKEICVTRRTFAWSVTSSTRTSRDERFSTVAANIWVESGIAKENWSFTAVRLRR